MQAGGYRRAGAGLQYSCQSGRSYLGMYVCTQYIITAIQGYEDVPGQGDQWQG